MSTFPITELGESHRPEQHHLLKVENLHVHYGKICALKNINFEIGCGHCVGLLGQNGAGKSTLLKTLAGLNRKISGTVTWSGKKLEDAKAEIAYLPQKDQMDPTFPLTVRGLVELGRYPHLGPRKKWRAVDSEIVEAAIEALKLEDLVGRRLFQLSGGQLQRVHIARALAQEAHVLLLDEPYSGLDEPSQDFLSELLRDLAQNGRLLLVCHHDLKAVPQLFDTVLMLNRGMVAFGPVDEVYTPEGVAKTFAKREDVSHV
ncbi:metal ABC transporter ATP-binding protein [Kiritimatiellota bacterium B12222]|nr:metal ABC transporter ATP-binding protein [Kiritimatiellota bacterium B12222]